MHGVPAAVVLLAVLIAVRAQGDPPQCVTTCMASASRAAGCSSSSDWTCMCAMTSFRSGVDRCFASLCSTTDAEIGENMVNIQCSGQTSTSIHPPFSPPDSTSLTVTNSETSPPQQSNPPPHSTISQAPPTPPPSSKQQPPPAPTQTATPPGSTATGTQPPGMSGVNPSSPPSLTPSAVGTPSSIGANATTSGTSTPSINTITPTIPSGTIQSAPTDTPGSSAGSLRVPGEALLGALLGLVSAWMLL